MPSPPRAPYGDCRHFSFTSVLLLKERRHTVNGKLYLRVLVLLPEPTDEQRSYPSFFPFRGDPDFTPEGMLPLIEKLALDYQKIAFQPLLNQNILLFLWLAGAENEVQAGHPMMAWVHVFDVVTIAALQHCRPLDIVHFSQVRISDSVRDHAFWTVSGSFSNVTPCRLLPERSAIGE